MKNHQAVRGFTLIELMIAVAIVGILAAVVLPNYSSYVQRGKITSATSTLSNQRIVMERWYQDNRDYDSTASTCGPPRPANDDFTYTCKWGSTSDDQSYLLTATGIAARGMGGFTFTLDHNNNKETLNFPGATGLPKPCWITKKDESC